MGAVWTVARQTVAESIRMRIAIFFIIVISVLVLLLPFVSKGDDTVSGAVQSFLSYSIASVTFLLSCLTIFLSKSLSNDLTDKQILILMTKPLSRSSYVLGKWLGIVMINLMILSTAGLVIYGMTMYLSTRTPRDDWDKERLENQILTARHSSRFMVPDFTAEANAQYERNLELGQYQHTAIEPEAEKERLRTDIERRWRSVWPLESRVFEFEDVRSALGGDDMVHVQYQHRVYNYPPDEIIRCMWYFGDPRKDVKQYEVPRRDVRGRRHTIPVPADAVADDATMAAVFYNANPFEGEGQFLNTVIFEGDDAVEVLFSVSGFGSNMVRALGLVFCRLTFLAAMAILAATLFSYPVACLVTFTVYILATLRAFMGDAFGWMSNESDVVGWISRGFQYFLDAFYFVMPDFSKTNALPLLVDGRNVTLKWLLVGFGTLVLIQTSIALLAACLIFQRREVSETSV